VFFRFLTWFVGGAFLSLGMVATWSLTTGMAFTLRFWWLGGIALALIELVVHAVMYARRLPNFYDGRL
jgi:hypothetical protein